MKILRIAMDGEEYPYYTFTKAFESNFDCKTIWWQQNLTNINELIIHEVCNNKYDAVFIQIQVGGIITEHTAKVISQHTICFNWTGDVRKDINWFVELGRCGFVTLFTNMTDVNRLRELSVKADYLQVGYDDKYYFPELRPCHNNIVFCANYYPENDFPLTYYRRELVEALKKEFGDKFNLYGGNWQKCNIYAELPFVNNQQEAEIYRTCAIAINCSHFDYSRYSSDRLLREMASGAFVLSHAYKDYNIDFKNNIHFSVWNTIPELIEKCHYYLNNAEERNQIAKQGSELVENTAKWNNRMKELIILINKYK